MLSAGKRVRREKKDERNDPFPTSSSWLGQGLHSRGTGKKRQSRELSIDPLGQFTRLAGSSLYGESTPVKHLFLQCLCTPEFARASHHCQGPPLPKHPKCAIHTWSCPREDGLGSDAEQTGER